MHCSKHENHTVNHCIHHLFWSKAVKQVQNSFLRISSFTNFKRSYLEGSPNLDVSIAVGWFHKSHHLSMLDSVPIDVDIHKSKSTFGNFWVRMDWNCRSNVQYCVKSLKEQPDLYVLWISTESIQTMPKSKEPTTAHTRKHKTHWRAIPYTCKANILSRLSNEEAALAAGVSWNNVTCTTELQVIFLKELVKKVKFLSNW